MGGTARYTGHTRLQRLHIRRPSSREIGQVPVPIDTLKPVAFSDNHIFCFTTDESGWSWLVAMRIERVA